MELFDSRYREEKKGEGRLEYWDIGDVEGSIEEVFISRSGHSLSLEESEKLMMGSTPDSIFIWPIREMVIVQVNDHGGMRISVNVAI